MLTVSDTQRRSRLAHRHGFAPGLRAGSVEEAARAVVAFHATEPATVYLSAFARVDDLVHADVDRALYADRTLVKQLAMRRTLFAFPRELLPAVWGSASARVATQQRGQLARDVERTGFAPDGAAWVAQATATVRDHLARTGGRTTAALRAEVPEVAGALVYAPDKPYGGPTPVAPRVLTLLAADAEIVRGANELGWRSSRPVWAPMTDWLGESAVPLPEPEGYRALVGRWLAAFGPGTETDLRWWLGGTAGAVRRALADLAAVAVRLDGGEVGYLLPDDLEPVPEVGPWAALLPVLDPSVMGWKERDWYLGPHAPRLFDTNGNAGTTAWWDGRVVGGWRQDDAGNVVLLLLEDVGAEGVRALQAEADRLTGWLDGTRVGTVYPSPVMKDASR